MSAESAADVWLKANPARLPLEKSAFLAGWKAAEAENGTTRLREEIAELERSNAELGRALEIERARSVFAEAELRAKASS